MSGAYPAIAWGAALDISGASWTNVGTPVVTGSVSDPFGGAGAYSIEDDDAGVTEGRFLNDLGAMTTADWIAVFIQENTANMQCDVLIHDGTAGTTRYRTRWVFSSGVLSFHSVITGTGDKVGPIDVGGGWYLVAIRADGIVAGNTHNLYLYPAANPNTGTTNFYVRRIVPLGVISDVVVYDEPGDGYDTARNDAGTEDAWVPSTVERIDMSVRHVAKGWVSSPQNIAGYDGVNTYASSMRNMLRAGRDKDDLLFVPEISDCSDYVTSKLVAPLEGAPQLDDDALRRFTLSLGNVGTPYEAYR